MERMMQLLYGRDRQPSTAADAATSSASGASAAAPGTGAGAADLLAGRRQAAGGGSSGGRDAESHRIIEKRRRDRVNGALAELCCLVPSARHKQSQGRIEKAEIIEMAIQHIILLTSIVGRYKAESAGRQIPALCAENFQQGFLDATRATLSFLAELEAAGARQVASTADPLCAHLYAHLQCALQKYASAASGEEDADISALLDSGSREVTPQQQQQPAPMTSSNPNMPASEPEAKHQATPREQIDSDSSSGEAGSNLDGGPHLPGFVLHPSGTHYLPLLLPQSALGKELLCSAHDDSTEDEADDSGRRREIRSADEVLHPVSIPVNFRTARRIRITGSRKRKRNSTADKWNSAESD